MKRDGFLLPAIADRANLVAAFHRAALGRRQTAAVRRFAADLDGNLADLARGILDGTVAVGSFVRLVVHDPKERVIHAPCFRERVLHHAIVAVCGPRFERAAIADSYACRPGKGNRAALLRALEFAGRRAHFLKMDVRRYFDSVDHGRVKARCRRLFKDGGILLLLDRIVDSYGTAPGKGLPIGTLISQYLANDYLDPLDRYVKEILRCRGYVRFMDDFALWHDDAGRLGQWEQDVTRFLQVELGLEPKDGTVLRPTAAGMPFLGCRVLHRGLLLGRQARNRFRLRLDECEVAWREGELEAPALQRRVHALVAFTDQARCRRWRRTLLARRAAAREPLAC